VNRHLRGRRFAAAAATLVVALAAVGCTLPDDTAEPVIGTDASTTTTTQPAFNVSERDTSSVLAVSAQVATLTPTGEGSWDLTLDGVGPTMARSGTGAAGAVQSADFFTDPTTLTFRHGTANSVLSGDVAGAGSDNIVMTVANPTLDGDDVATFQASTVPTGEIDRGLARAGGVPVTGDGQTTPDVTTLPVEDPDVIVVTNATLYLDVAGTKVLDDCPMVPATSCPGADLFQSDLVGANLAGSNLAGVNFAMSTLRNSNFDNTDLRESQLFRSDLTSTSWVDADIRNANAHQVTLTESDLTGIRAQATNLFRSELDRTTLVDADFSGAALQQSTITDADARNAKFLATNLFRVEMSGINLNGATLTDSNLAQTIAQGARMSGANLSHTDLTVIDLRNADLSNADLSYANLAGANLNGANLTGANLTGAVLWMADLNGANLGWVTWSNTTCPDGGITQQTNRGTVRKPVIQQVCGPIFLPQVDNQARQVGPRSTDAGIGPRAGTGNSTTYGSRTGNTYGN
jgi:uncharacterized protein YjbI with pentapeptide repeats